MIIEIDMVGDTPIYQQIRNHIVFGVATGDLKIGEKLPTVRQLAGDIGVNPMTVSKAYKMLKEEGLIVMDRRHGAEVNHTQLQVNPLDKKFSHKFMLLISESLIKGASKEELKEYTLYLIDSIYEQKEK